ncbi:PLP-dependent aminotransferase family protein [Anaeroselena agilis]|uniref:PLP-dependent aminotransferase family protein n=1 Tax=Anaeroselena agilis TaxID=3063788 RepID=A0ABU3NSU7_9FIRM|nr:PLP-dependent aminotransferase family protein [Selenomonadales bacterium 4137-cl]
MFTLSLDRAAKLSLTRQLYSQIRQRILDGRLPEHHNLPPTRKLAAHYRISRNVVMEAYDLLRIEGFIESRQGGYTFVASGARLTHLPPQQPPELPSLRPPAGVIDFRYGLPALDLFPRAAWQKTVARTMAAIPDSALGYSEVAGCRELRSALAAYLARTRGVNCSPEQIVITAGATSALALIARLLLTGSRKVIISDPVNQDVYRYLATLGCELTPVPLDDHGLQTELLAGHAATPPAFTLVTPSHQFPTGGLLPVQRRIQLINFARSTGSYIVEDDYENEYAYEGSPISSLQGLDPEKVAYIGTFSKTLAPFLRLGYIVLPPALLAAFHAEGWFATHQPSAVCQSALASFMGTGQLRRHIAKMIKAYQARHVAVVRELGHHFGEDCRILSGPAGLHLTAAFPGADFSPAVLARIENGGVRVYAVRQHVIARDGGAFADQLILGYGGLREEEIATGIARLRQALASLP